MSSATSSGGNVYIIEGRVYMGPRNFWAAFPVIVWIITVEALGGDIYRV